MVLEDIVKALTHIGAFEMKHSGRHLGDHLLNTMELLYKQGAPEEVCIAGAFHSVYGTNAYINNAIDHSEREKYQDILGKDVERLVYIFSTSNRPEGFESGDVLDFKTGEKIDVTDTELLHLRLMEAANLLEQKCSLLRYPNIHKTWHSLK